MLNIYYASQPYSTFSCDIIGTTIHETSVPEKGHQKAELSCTSGSIQCRCFPATYGTSLL